MACWYGSLLVKELDCGSKGPTYSRDFFLIPALKIEYWVSFASFRLSTVVTELPGLPTIFDCSQYLFLHSAHTKMVYRKHSHTYIT